MAKQQKDIQRAIQVRTADYFKFIAIRNEVGLSGAELFARMVASLLERNPEIAKIVEAAPKPEPKKELNF